MANKTFNLLAADGSVIPVELVDQTDGTYALRSATAKVLPATAASYRAGLTAPDVLAPPATPTVTVVAGGSAAAGTYNVFVVAGNKYGRTTAVAGNATGVTSGGNLTVRVAIAQVSGAEFYDLYVSTDGANAKFVGRVTETQRASGILITGQNTTGAGGTAGAVDVQVNGTGLAVSGGQLAQNFAYIPEGLAHIDPAGAQNVDLDVLFTRSGDIVAPALTLIPFYAGASGAYFAGEPINLSFGGALANYYPLRQTFRLPCRGRLVTVVVASIAGTGASVDMFAIAN